MTDIEVTPPLGDERPHGDRTCGRMLGEGYCGAPGAWHVLWVASTMDNSICCAEHMAEAEGRWPHEARHEVSPDCTTPGSRWWPDRCSRDDGSTTVAESAAVRPA